MGEHVRVTPLELHYFAYYMEEVARDFNYIGYYALHTGCDTSGFTGLLAILHQVVREVGERYGDVLQVGRDRLEGAAEGLHKVADNYEKTDAHHATAADTLANQLPAGG